jgi:hypothetical protein
MPRAAWRPLELLLPRRRLTAHGPPHPPSRLPTYCHWATSARRQQKSMLRLRWDRSLNQGQFRSFEEGHLESVPSFVSFRAHRQNCLVLCLLPSRRIRLSCALPMHVPHRVGHFDCLCLCAGGRMFNSPRSTHCSYRGVGPSRRSLSARRGCRSRDSRLPCRTCPL